jgi:hypothetical protein
MTGMPRDSKDLLGPATAGDLSPKRLLIQTRDQSWGSRKTSADGCPPSGRVHAGTAIRATMPAFTETRMVLCGSIALSACAIESTPIADGWLA